MAFILIFGQGINLLSGTFLARVLGPEQYGKYTFLFSLMTVLLLPVIAGNSQFVVRELSKFISENKNSVGRVFFLWNLKKIALTCLFSVLLICLYFIIVYDDSISNDMVLTVCFIMIIKSVFTLKVAVGVAYQKQIKVKFLESILFPALFLFSLLVVYFFELIDLRYILLCYFLALFICLFIPLKLDVKYFFKKRSGLQRSYKTQLEKEWFKALVPFAFIGVMTTFNSELSILLLSFMATDETIAYYRVAYFGSSFLGILLIAVNTMNGPKIASTLSKGNTLETQKLLNIGVRFSSLIAIIAFILLALFGSEIIVIFFGEQYSSSYLPLLILLTGQTFNIIFGSVGLVLSMSGNERETLKILPLSLMFNVFLLIILTPYFHEIGAAIATSATLIFTNVLMAYKTYKKTSLKTWLQI